MFDHRVVGDNVTVIKSPYYYDQGAVHLDKIVFKPMPDAAAAAAALKAGDIQVLDEVSTDRAAGRPGRPEPAGAHGAAARLAGIVINIGNKNGVGNLPYANVGTPLASSAKLRQAFEEAIDRNALNKVVFGGLDQPSCTPIPPANTAWYDATKVPCTPYDPADAKKLVAASGFPNPTVHLLTPNATDCVRLAQFIQAEEAAVGINVVIDSPTTPADVGAAEQRELRRAGSAAASRAAPTRTDDLPVPRDRGRQELQRLLEPAARLRPRERAEGDEPKARAVDLPRRAADHPRRPADHRPLQRGHIRGVTARTCAGVAPELQRQDAASRTRSSGSKGRQRGGSGDVSLLLVEPERRRDRGIGFVRPAGRSLDLGERKPDAGALSSGDPLRSASSTARCASAAASSSVAAVGRERARRPRAGLPS